METLIKRNFKYGKNEYEIAGQVYGVFQNSDTDLWNLVNDSEDELILVAKTKKEIMSELKQIEEGGRRNET